MTRTICSGVSTRLFLFSSMASSYIFFFFCFFIFKLSPCSFFFSLSLSSFLHLSLYLLFFLLRLPTDVNPRVGDRRSLACSISASLYQKLTSSNMNTNDCIFSFRDLSGEMRKTSRNYSYLIT